MFPAKSSLLRRFFALLLFLALINVKNPDTLNQAREPGCNCINKIVSRNWSSTMTAMSRRIAGNLEIDLALARLTPALYLRPVRTSKQRVSSHKSFASCGCSLPTMPINSSPRRIFAACPGCNAGCCVRQSESSSSASKPSKASTSAFMSKKSTLSDLLPHCSGCTGPVTSPLYVRPPRALQACRGRTC